MHQMTVHREHLSLEEMNRKECQSQQGIHRNPRRRLLNADGPDPEIKVADQIFLFFGVAVGGEVVSQCSSVPNQSSTKTSSHRHPLIPWSRGMGPFLFTEPIGDKTNDRAMSSGSSSRFYAKKNGLRSVINMKIAEIESGWRRTSSRPHTMTQTMNNVI